VATPKRDRQKLNRQLRLEELARDARKKRTSKLAWRLGLGIPLAVAFLFGLVWLFGDDDNDSTSATTTPALDGTPLDTSVLDTSVPATVAVPSTVAGAAITGETPCPAADGSSERATSFEQAPPMCIDTAKSYTAVIDTNKGAYTVQLDPGAAPNTVNNFVVLARYHFFDGTPCHRIIPEFMAQCGDPTGTGSGGPGYEFEDELPTGDAPYAKGAVAMANSGPNTQGSQFFTVTGEGAANLPADYTVFGMVTDGLDTTLAAINAAGNPDSAANGVPPVEPVTINSVTITES
jgi:cyclophilin family peptidyl-prolyl cis-trans isomerase